METGAEAVSIEVVSAVVVVIEGASGEEGEVTGEDSDPARWTQGECPDDSQLLHILKCKLVEN